jgi:hypothetical protein
MTATVAASVIATMGDVTQILRYRYLDIQGKYNYFCCYVQFPSDFCCTFD